MKLTVLVDNNTLIGKENLSGEPGASYYIEEAGNRILLDLGYSDNLVKNARQLGIDLAKITHIIFSHGHFDHTWGLAPLIEEIKASGRFKGKSSGHIVVVAHPQISAPKEDGEVIGMGERERSLLNSLTLRLSKEPVWLSDKLVFLGEIPRRNSFENKTPLGFTVENGRQKEDYLHDDSALAYKGENGLVVITGCSHSGICNIIEYAKEVCGENRVADVIGGFHLLDPEQDVLDKTLEYFRELQPEKLHACHCTDLRSKIALAGAANLLEVGVGLSLEY